MCREWTANSVTPPLSALRRNAVVIVLIKGEPLRACLDGTLASLACDGVSTGYGCAVMTKRKTNVYDSEQEVLTNSEGITEGITEEDHVHFIYARTPATSAQVVLQVEALEPFGKPGGDTGWEGRKGSSLGDRAPKEIVRAHTLCDQHRVAIDVCRECQRA